MNARRWLIGFWTPYLIIKVWLVHVAVDRLQGAAVVSRLQDVETRSGLTFHPQKIRIG